MPLALISGALEQHPPHATPAPGNPRTRTDLLVALGATALGFEYDDPDGSKRSICTWTDAGRPAPSSARGAGGGRQREHPAAARRTAPAAWRFGGPGGPLGRFYMGHVNGQIADITLITAHCTMGMNFHVDGNGSYVRRRLVPSVATQTGAELANVAFWPVMPAIADPGHRMGPLSAIFLGLSIGPLGRRLIAEPIRLKHVGPPPTVGRRICATCCSTRLAHSASSRVPWENRLAKIRLPGFFLENAARRYGLEYHSEHLPAAESRLTLTEATDRLGLPRLAIDLRFSEADAASVLGRTARSRAGSSAMGSAARLLRAARRPRRAGAGPGQARQPPDRHDPHGHRPYDGGGGRRLPRVRCSQPACDLDRRAADLGQANPTLTAVQLGLRLAAHLAGQGGSPIDPP